MSLDPQTEAALALHRFGFGPRAETIAKIASDPRGALLADIDRAGAGALADPDLLTSAEAAQAARDFRQVRKAARLAQQIQRDAGQQAARQAAQRAARNAKAGADMQPGDMQQGSEMMASAATRDPGPAIPQQILLEEAKARLDAATAADIGFAERLVWFWSNHFCISASKGGGVAALAGAYEREAIRPHVLGHFGEMLLAVETHPAMLLYLDNARSIGPDSPAGRDRRQGSQREPRARDPRAAYARRAHRLQPGRRDPVRRCHHRLEHRAAAARIAPCAASSSSIRACTSRPPRR